MSLKLAINGCSSSWQWLSTIQAFVHSPASYWDGADIKNKKNKGEIMG